MTSDVLSSMDSVLESIGVSVVTVGDREISARCPFHADNHPSFSMNAENGLWICYQCGERGTLDMLIVRLGGTEAKPDRILREIKRQSIGVEKEEKRPAVEEDPFVLPAMYRSYKNPPAWALESRMILPEVAERYGIKWDRGWVIPIIKPFEDRLLGWQFKAPGVVLNYPRSVKKSITLFGYQQADFKEVALVESPLDVARLASVGVNAVASYGAFVSKEQVRLLIELADRVSLALDNDEEGHRQSDKLYPVLARYLPVKKINYPLNKKDPGDLSDKEALEVFG